MLLVCRNSTDTAYFQRLRPYPRVLLRRQNARFKVSAPLRALYFLFRIQGSGTNNMNLNPMHVYP